MLIGLRTRSVIGLWSGADEALLDYRDDQIASGDPADAILLTADFNAALSGIYAKVGMGTGSTSPDSLHETRSPSRPPPHWPFRW